MAKKPVLLIPEDVARRIVIMVGRINTLEMFVGVDALALQVLL